MEFRKILGAIEKQLFELLPDQFQRPLEKILGGNPFDSQLDRDASGPADRGFGDDIKSKLLSKIRALVQKVQETLRESILGVVNGGHRKFERQSWVFVQGMVEQKVQRYLPDVKINVPDDIGNENVSVGSPTANTSMGGGYQPPSQPPHGDHRPPPTSGSYSGQEHVPQGYNNPPQYQSYDKYREEPRREYQDHQASQYPPPQDYRPEHHGPRHEGYAPQQYQPPQHHRPESYPSQDYRSEHHAPPTQGYHQGPPDYRSEQYPPSQQGYPQQEYSQRDYRGDGYRRQDY